jgi:uncharacterized protein (TIGR03437 family)
VVKHVRRDDRLRLTFGRAPHGAGIRQLDKSSPRWLILAGGSTGCACGAKHLLSAQDPRRILAFNSDGKLNGRDEPANDGELLVSYATSEGQTPPAGQGGIAARKPILTRPKQTVFVDIYAKSADVLS